MISTLARNWILLVVCSILYAIISVIYLVMADTGGAVTFHSWNGAVVLLGKLAVGAGLGTIAASVWRSSGGKCWLLALHGVALGALGMIQYGLTGFRIGFLTVALLVVAMAVSAAILALTLAHALGPGRHAADRWFLTLAGVTSGGFAVAFLALGLRWIEIQPGSHLDLLWLGSYFGFSAICMLALALRLHGHDFSRPDLGTPLPAFGSPAAGATPRQIPAESTSAPIEESGL